MAEDKTRSTNNLPVNKLNIAFFNGYIEKSKIY